MISKILKSIGIPILLFLPAGLNAQCWELVWSDEFNYTGFPDPAYWTYETGGGGWGNNELQYYKADDEDNCWVADGMLTITAINESYGGRDYTSARIITRDKFSFQYGKFEASMKLPYSKGLWAAFWAMGQNIGQVGWPACGEIDIMEFIGGTTNDSKIYSTLHWDNNGHQQYGTSYTLPEGIFADTFHVISCEWSPTTVRTFVDGKQFYVIDIRPDYLSEFHQDFFILLNLAVGGNWPGSPDATSVFPNTYELDYVRVYKMAEDIAGLEIEGDTVLPQKASNKTFSLPAGPGWTYEWTVPGDAEIVSGQGTESIKLNWGCTEGEISCTVQGECQSYVFTKQVGLGIEINGPMFIAENEQAVLFFTDSLGGSSFQWTVPDDAEIVSGQGSDSITVNWGISFEDVQLEIVNECGTFVSTFDVIKKGQYPYPDIFTAHPVPGEIESVDYDYGGEGIAYHDTGAGNNGSGPRPDENVDTEYNDNGSPNVGWISNSEWLEYSIDVQVDTFYRINMRVATDNASGGPFSVHFNGEERLSGITVSNTGGWDSFTTKNIGTVYLTTEDTLMRIFFNTGGFNIGKMTFTPTSDPTIGILDRQKTEGLDIYPVPAGNSLIILSGEPVRQIRLMDFSGRVLKEFNAQNQNRIELDISQYPNGTYLLDIELDQGIKTSRKFVKKAL